MHISLMMKSPLTVYSWCDVRAGRHARHIPTGHTHITRVFYCVCLFYARVCLFDVRVCLFDANFLWCVLCVLIACVLLGAWTCLHCGTFMDITHRVDVCVSCFQDIQPGERDTCASC